MTAELAAAGFDALAPDYDALWSDSTIGRRQREAVWRRVDRLFRPGDRILDLGCGTGRDALHFQALGVEVNGIDASEAMVHEARARGVKAERLPIEEIARLDGPFQGAISNFGALNPVADLRLVAAALSRLILPQGHLALCLMGPCCAWEIGYYAARLRFGKAFRRWNPRGARTSLGFRVRYPSAGKLERCFAPWFRLMAWYGIGLAVPPSYVAGLSERQVERLAAIDRRLAHRPLFRALADHRLLIFRRL